MLVNKHINMVIVTIIPARGGSKGVKKKNIRLLNNKPLIAYSIEYSLKCNLVQRTIVSTDDLEIADIAKEYGAEAPFLRPAEYAQDDTLDYSVFNHALNWLQTNENLKIDILVLLRPTSPLRPLGLIEKGYHLLEGDPEASSIRTVALCRQHPYRMFKIYGDSIVPILKEALFEPYNIPRQKLPEVYFQTGDLEMIRGMTIAKEKSISGSKILPLIINQEEIMDIDKEADFKLAADKVKNRLYIK